MKLIIAGGRDFDNRDLLYNTLDLLSQLEFKPITQVITGGAKGADELGKQWAKDRGHDHLEINADWHTLGKAAGPIRNTKMAEIGEALVAFWNGESSGTGNMISTAKSRQLFTRVIPYTSFVPAKHLNAVEYLMFQVEQMRQHQRNYFAWQKTYDKQQAILWEQKVDATIAKLKARGYSGERFKDTTSQSKMF